MDRLIEFIKGNELQCVASEKKKLLNLVNGAKQDVLNAVIRKIKWYRKNDFRCYVRDEIIDDIKEM